MNRSTLACLLANLLLGGAVAAEPPAFTLAPAVVAEAEDFTVESGWRPIKMGEGNYNVDIIGFCHVSGERFLHVDGSNTTAAAYRDVTAPEAGPYRLWVRYEYMPFTEAQFRVTVEQGGKVVAEKIMGGRENLRTTPWSDGTELVKQYDPPWGNEGLTEEPLDVPALAAGPVRLWLRAVDQPRIEGRTANRNIDVLYLTRDIQDAWRRQPAYKQWYGILPLIRDTVGARYEVRFTNRGTQAVNFATSHVYNRSPWGARDAAASTNGIAPGTSSAWLSMPMQDVSHFSLTWFTPSPPQPFTVAVSAVGDASGESAMSAGEAVGFFLPPYSGTGDRPLNVLTALDSVIAAVKAAQPAPGREPTRPLCYGGCIPYEQDNAYGRKYAELFKVIGMRNTGPFVNGGVNDRAKHYRNLEAVGLEPTRSAIYMEYRFPPTPANVAKAKELMTKSEALAEMRWFDYGDEIGFSEWFTYMVEQQRQAESKPDLQVEDMILPLWQDWLKKHRRGYRLADYWRDSWGQPDPARLRPDASAEAAAEKPRLYVDSVIFYEDVSIGFVAEGAAAVKAAFGEQVLPGCNYSCYPYYYPHTPMYVKWFRRGAGEKGQHSEYFWQLGQVTPMINGFVAEYFRAGMRFNPRAVLKQYTMPHSPGNTDASFRRTAFTHWAHGAKNLDFFGIGLPETFTENHISFRDPDRYVAIRDITHSIALVEDIWETAQYVPAEVALLVSEATERWDGAKIANDHLAKHPPARNFRDHRLTFHQERVGIYTALTFAGAAPDLVVEEDLLNPKVLNGYKVLFLVGDCLPLETVPALVKWVKRGGVLFATAGAGQYGMYREPNPALAKLLGIDGREIAQKDWFIRTSQELPFLEPAGSVTNARGVYPALAIRERVTPAEDATVLATFAGDGTAAAIRRRVGKGQVFYSASLPGLAYLWTGLTTPRIEVADRGPGVHRAVNTYDSVAADQILEPLAAAGVSPRVVTEPGYIDTRLLRGKGAWILPLANYREKVGEPVTVTIRPPRGAGKPIGAVAAFNGRLDVQVHQDTWTVTIPALGYGEILRINVR